MEGFLQKLKNHKIVLFCIALFLVALIMVIFIATRSTPAPREPERTSTDAESTTIETTTEETTTVPPETTTEETTTVPPETQTVRLSDYDQISEGSLYGYLSCEKIGLNCSVYMGDDSYILRKGAGQIPATFLPGEGGLIMLGAHNNSYFNCLQYSEIGDIITLETSYGIYQYQVVSTETVDVSDKNAYDFYTNHEQLLLYTCYPFDTLSSTVYRYMVHADLISGPSVVD